MRTPCFRVVGLGLVLLFGLLESSSAANPTHDVWLISGQSNACGRGKLPGAKSDPRAQVFNTKTNKWEEAKEPLIGLNGSVGPWLKAATSVTQGGVPVRITGFASGGKPISFWDDVGSGWRSMKANYDRAKAQAGVFLFYQGESDGAKNMDEKTYTAKLAALIKRTRALTRNPGLVVVVVQLGLWTKKSGTFMAIREAQRKVVAADPNTLLVTALGRTAKDYVHLNSAGYFELGDEIARALLKFRYKRTNVDWPGPVMDQAILTAPNQAVVHFAEVNKLGGVNAADFGALDAGGEAKCTKAQAGLTRVALTFERPLKAPAKVLYGFGNNPKATLVDAAGNRAPAVQLNVTRGAVPPDKPTKAPRGAGPK